MAAGQIGKRHDNLVYRPTGDPVRYTLPAGVRIKNVNTIAQKVLDGRIVAGPLIRQVCRTHVEDQTRDRKTFPFRFDRKRGMAVVHWIETHCRLAKAQFEGKPFKLNWWELLFVSMLFGWTYRKGRYKGERRYRKAYLEQAKGSGKTPLEAAIAMYMLCADGETRGEGFVIGKNANQAAVTMEFLGAMAAHSPTLDAMVVPTGGTNLQSFRHPESASVLKKVTSESEGKGKSGPMPNVIIADEYHEHISSATLDFYEAGTKLRESPLTLIGTNAGGDLASACGIEHTYAEGVVTGEEDDPHYLAFIFSGDEEDTPLDDALDADGRIPDSWLKTNPSLPVTPGVRYIEDQIRRARGLPSKRSTVERLQFCIWTEAVDPWIDRAAWLACETHDDPPKDIYQQPSYLALDLSKKTDLSSLALVTDLADGTLWHQSWSWTPENTIVERSKRDKAPYEGWVDAGYLATTPGSVIDYEFICLRIQELLDIYNISVMCYDAWKIDLLLAAAKNVNLRLTKFPDRPGLLVIPHAQGFQRETKKLDEEGDPSRVAGLWMPQSIEDAEERILTNRLRSAYNPLVRAAVLGAVVLPDGSENRKFAKNKTTRRIDPCVSMVMDIGLAEAVKPARWDIGSFVAGATGATLQ